MTRLPRTGASGPEPSGQNADPFTMELRLCDDHGLVSDTPVEPGSPGTILDPDLTYLKMHNNMRARNRNPDTRKPVEEGGWQCTGHAHLGGEHIRCTGPAHTNPVPAVDAALRTGTTIIVGGDTFIAPGSVVIAMTQDEAEKFRSALLYARSMVRYHGPDTEAAQQTLDQLLWGACHLAQQGVGPQGIRDV